MPLITETYYLSLTQDNRGILRLRCSQDDTLRTVNLKLYNNGSIFVIPSGVSASISGVKQNGAVFSKPCTISQDRESVVLQLSSDITNIDGIIVAEIVLNDGEGGRLGTSNFIIQVEKNPIRAGVVQDTETPIEYINDFIEKIQTLTARLNNLITPSGDPSLAEVVDARIGILDSTTYQTLGARLNAEFQRLSNTINGVTILESTGDTTDRTSEILSKLNAYGACKLGKGDFYVNGLVMPEDSMLMGSGKSTRVILPSAVTNGSIVKPRNNCIVENISFYGGFTGTYSELIASSNARRHCIILDKFNDINSENVILSNIFINNFVGSAIVQRATNVCHCKDVVISMCYAGIDISNASYDGRCANVYISNTKFGTTQNGSNFVFSGCTSKDSEYHITSDQQNTECTFSSCTFFDSSLETASILAYLSNARNGFVFDNCTFDSSLVMGLNACDGIVIKGTNFVGSDTFTIAVYNSRNTLLLITDCIADVEPTVTNAGTAARITSCYLKDGTAWSISEADITVDDELSDESENPVQNKVINRAIGEIKADLGDLEDLETTDKSSIVAAINEAAQSSGCGAVVVTNSSEMENTSQIYLYEGTETGYIAGHFYYNNGSAWVDGGQYYVGRDGRNGQDGADGVNGSDGVDGADGQDGQDGFSPIATVEATSTGVRISITDKTGTTSATVQNGTATDAQVSAWLEAHPEATTTVQDGSISKSKLASDVLVPVNDVSTIKKVIGNNIVSASSAFDNITWATGYFHPTTGAVTGNSQYRYTEEYFNTTILQFVKKCALQTKNIACVVFYDGDKEIVGVINTTSNGGALVVTSISVPSDAVYFRLCQIATNINPLPISFYTIEELFAKSETDLPVDIQSVLTSQGGINVDGNLSTYNDWKVTDYIKVVPGMLLKYSGCGNIGGNATLCPIAFYDSDKNPILVIRPTESRYVSIYNTGWANDSAIGTSLNFGFIFAPPAARYCRLSGYRTLQPTISVTTIEPWAGKKCAFFGDSITAGIGTVEKYCNFLAMIKGITVANYAVNGSILVTNGMDRVTAFVTDYADKEVDAFIFAYGTNDWGNNKPLGEWYTTDSNGVRTLSTDITTFRGAWVRILTYLKTNFDGKKIILMTPIHRGAGSYASDLTRNTIGLYLEDYVKVVKEAGEIFSAEVIDLYGESGLNPNINPSTKYFTPNDRLHPNVEGHKQMARVISAKMGKMTI